MNKLAKVEIFRYVYAAKNRDRQIAHDPCGELLYAAQVETGSFVVQAQAEHLLDRMLHECANDYRTSVVGRVSVDGEAIVIEELFLVGPKVKTMCTKDCCR